MHMLVMPPGTKAKPHYHEKHEIAIYMLEGISEFHHGPNLNLPRELNRAIMFTFPPVCRTNLTIQQTSQPRR